jgi:recombination protein RecA
MWIGEDKAKHSPMSAFHALRLKLEASLAHRIPSALTPAPLILREVERVGIHTIDELLQGGLPAGAITEIIGPDCSGRTSLSLSFTAQMMQAGKVCAWVDVSSALHLESAAAIGIDLCRLLWVRCGAQSRTQTATNFSTDFAIPDAYLAPPPIKKGLHGGGGGPHPRSEARDMSGAVTGLLRPELLAPRCAEAQRRIAARH